MRVGPGRGVRVSLVLAIAASGVPGVVADPASMSPEEQEPGTIDVETIPGTDVSFRMAYVPGGTFLIGSPESEPGRSADEGPRRSVTLEPFWIGAHEVTYDEYAIFRFRRLDSERTAVPGVFLDVDAVTRPSPPYEDPARGMGDGAHPAVGMTQRAALEYARWLSAKTGRLYRLPTEAEWEYACRGGTPTAYGFGDDPAELERYAWYAANAGDSHHRVGAKRPNRWGLFDMLGNVAEWTMDAYDPDFYATLEGTGGVAAAGPRSRPGPVARHTVRGGAFGDDASGVRCASRLPSTPDWQRRDPQLPKSRWWNTDSPHVGFRLVRPAVELSLEEVRAYWDDLLGG